MKRKRKSDWCFGGESGQKVLLVIYVTDNRKVVPSHFIHTGFVKWSQNFFMSNPSVFKDVINFCKPTFNFFWKKLEF